MLVIIYVPVYHIRIRQYQVHVYVSGYIISGSCNVDVPTGRVAPPQLDLHYDAARADHTWYEVQYCYYTTAYQVVNTYGLYRHTEVLYNINI